jgi:hypothetical protein
MANAWIEHVKRFQQAHGCSYTDALKGASASYRSMKGSGNMRDLHSALSSKKARKYIDRAPPLSSTVEMDTGIGYGVGRRNKYTKWVGALGAKDLIDAGFSKGTSTINGSGMTKKQAISALQMANAMYGDQAMSQLKTHRRKLSGMALYPAGM